MSEREIRAAIDKVRSDLELKNRRGLLRPGARAALLPIAIGAAGIAAIACSAEPLLADGGQGQDTTTNSGSGGMGAGATSTATPPGGGAGTGAAGGIVDDGCGGQGGFAGGCEGEGGAPEGGGGQAPGGAGGAGGMAGAGGG